MVDKDIRPIDWSILRHSRGVASDIPDLLARVSESCEYDQAEQALFELGERVCHQGISVSEATSYVLPLLLGVVEGDSPVRVKAFRLVVKISRSSHVWRRSAENSPVEFRSKFKSKIEWETSLDQAFRDSLPVLYRLEGDRNPDIREMAAVLAEKHR